MNIICVLHSHECGGAEKHALQLMQAAQRAGHAVVYAGPADSWLAEQAIRSGIDNLNLGLHGLFDLVSLGKLALFAKRWRADILHGHLTRGAFYAGMAGKLTGIAAISTAHSTNTHKHFHLSHKIIAVSEAARNHLLAKNYPSEQVVTIHNGIPDEYDLSPEASTLARHALGIKPDELALCMVARFIYDKGHDILFDALSRLPNMPFRLFLIGKSDGAWYNDMIQQVHSLALDDKVVFLGHREDVAGLLPAMDIYLTPSRREAMPLSILEACATGLPVIASRVGGIPEAITHGENGLLFTTENVTELTAALKLLLEDAKLRQRLGQQARQTYLQRFSLASMVDKTLEQYRKLTA